MIFTNIHMFSILIWAVLLIWGWYLYIRLLKKHGHKNQIYLLLFLLPVLCISLFWPKGAFTWTTSATLWWNIAFVIDVSKSMDALDFDDGSISRLQMTKQIISRFISQQPNNKYALDVFSWEAVKVLPLTDNISIYETFLSWINESNVGKSWTDIIKALYSSASHFISDEWWLIVIFTDGGDDDIWDIWDIADVLKQKNIDVLLVWIWSKKWSYIPVWRDFFGRTVYKIYNWKKVITKLNHAELKYLSQDIWLYREIESIWDIDTLYGTIDSISKKITFESDTENRRDLIRFFMFLWFLIWLWFLW